MAKRQKNVLLVSFDDAFSFWHYKTIFGAALKTPNLDRICASSTAFHAAYCQSPLCGPSRASFMSGRTPHQTQVFGNKTSVFETVAPEEMWSYRLKANGYFCSSGGKVHHGFKPLDPPVHEVLYSDHRKGFRIDVTLRESIAQSRSGGSGGGVSTTDPKDDGYYHDAQAAASFVEFIEGYDGDAPFYREVGFYSPHSPFITPHRFKEMYRLNDFHMPESWVKGFQNCAYSEATVRKNFGLDNLRKWKKSVRNYFSAVSHGDHHLGTVWDALKASTHAENTMVVILTDHGHHLGERHRFGKSTLWEQSALVPFIIHDPARPEARVVSDPVALLDVGPTILDCLDLPPLEQTAGRSLRQVVEGGPADPERAVPTFNPIGSAIRKGPYRFIRYQDGSTELYDIAADWWQQELLGPLHPAHDPMAAAHRACCEAYYAPAYA